MPARPRRGASPTAGASTWCWTTSPRASTREVKRHCRKSNIRLVYTATCASWMNRIERHFAPFRRFVLDNSDWSNHSEIARASQGNLRWGSRDKKNAKILKEQDSIRTL